MADHSLRRLSNSALASVTYSGAGESAVCPVVRENNLRNNCIFCANYLVVTNKLLALSLSLRAGV